MIEKIQRNIERELKNLARDIDKRYCLNTISPIISRNIAEFILRPGKRIRPLLFVLGYLGFAKKPAPPGLYASSLCMELLHDFMLVHDDIIDKSDLRRGRPSMHSMLKKHISGNKNVKFSGEDLAIVIGDVIYAMAIDTIMIIRENPLRKEKALKQFVRAAMYTGSGEFIELLCGTKGLNNITKEDIYKIYDYKTAYYTFACPLSIGATLAGAKPDQIRAITKYGIYLGRAFQIKDDILGMFGDEEKIGKSILTDLQEAKKTILIWHAYNHSSEETKRAMERIFAKKTVAASDLKTMRELIASPGSLRFAKQEVSILASKAANLIGSSKMMKRYKDFLCHYSRKILDF